MNITAICCKSFLIPVRKATGVTPLLCPPITLSTFKPASLEGADLLYVKLHGLPKQPYLYGDRYLTAISTDQIRDADLSDTLVFAPVCHLPSSPLLSAFLEAGASGVIAGHGINYGTTRRLRATDLLGAVLIEWLRRGLSPDRALRMAKLRLMLGRQDRPTQDTLKFQLFTKENLT